MVSPALIRNIEKEERLEFNDNTKELFRVIYEEKNKKVSLDEDLPRIKVSSLVSRLAFFYEKARNAIEYEEEHLLRKTAIARILKRQIIIEGVIRQINSKETSFHLLTEIIRGGYLDNNSVPETKIDEVAFILEKYMTLKDFLLSEIGKSFDFKLDIKETKDKIKEKNSLNNWILTLAACEIEENLSQNKSKKLVVSNMFSFLKEKIELPVDLLQYKEEKDIQIYLSIARSYLKLDWDILSFVLFKYYNSFWFEFNKKNILGDEDKKKISVLAKNFFNLKKTIEKDLEHPLKKQLDKITRAYSLYFNVLTETIDKDPLSSYAELQKSDKSFVATIKKVCNQKYQKAKTRLWRSAVRSIIYIFLTKSVFVLAVEVPAIRWFGEELNIISLLINIVFPAVLLFFIVLTTRKPGDKNTDKIVSGVKEIALKEKDKKSALILRKPQKRSFITASIFNLIYTASFCFSVYLIIKILTFINFTWVSIVIFLFFLAFVSFFSIVTTKGVKELMVVERRESVISLLLDLFYLPIIMAGRWLSGNMSKVNVFIFILDFVIEAPFKIFIDIIEDWTRYVREKRENID